MFGVATYWFVKVLERDRAVEVSDQQVTCNFCFVIYTLLYRYQMLGFHSSFFSQVP